MQPVAAAVATTLVDEKMIPEWFSWIKKIFEHDHHDEHAHSAGGKPHAHGEACGHAHAPVAEAESGGSKLKKIGARMKSEFKLDKLWHNTKHWVVGEVGGDVGGIIPTIMVQRFFPGMMQCMRKALEPIAGGFFHHGADKDAIKWGRKRGLAEDSPEVKHKAAELYEHEMSHLPQAVVWNSFSIPMNYGTQLLYAQLKGHAKPTLGEFAVGKVFGTVLSNTVLIGGRGMAPEAFNHWDRLNSKHVIKPLMGTLGIDRATIERIDREDAHRRGDDTGHWQERVKDEEVVAAQPVTAAR